MLLVPGGQVGLGIELVQEGGVRQVEVGQGHIGGRIKLAFRDVKESIGKMEIRGVWDGVYMCVEVIIIVGH